MLCPNGNEDLTPEHIANCSVIVEYNITLRLLNWYPYGSALQRHCRLSGSWSSLPHFMYKSANLFEFFDQSSQCYLRQWYMSSVNCVTHAEYHCNGTISIVCL